MNARIDGTSESAPRGFGRRAAGVAARGAMATWRLVLVVLFVLGGAAIGGFLNFVHEVRGLEERAAAEAPASDAVVVLTGGPRRINAGLELISAGRGERLLISGVNPVTSGNAIQRTAAATDAVERARLFACCVDLGRRAADTVGNAVEARDWIRARGFDDVLVVTANYHMPRSLLEFERALAEAGGEAAPVRLVAWPVSTPLIEGDWYRDPAAIRRLAAEWVKYLSAQSKGWFGAEFLKEWFPNAG